MSASAPESNGPVLPQRMSFETARNLLLNRMGAERFNKFEDLAFNALSSRVDLFKRFMDPRRDINDECGYPQTTDFQPEAYRDLFDREPIAARIVEIWPKECWQIQPTVYEDEDSENETEFEMAWDEMGQGLRGEKSWFGDEKGSPVWEYLRRVDILSGVGHFGVLLLGLDDGKDLQEPVEGVVGLQDSYITKNEQSNLENMKDGVIEVDMPRGGKLKSKVFGLNQKEKMVVNRWAAEREMVVNRDEGETGKGPPRFIVKDKPKRETGQHIDPKEPTRSQAVDSKGRDPMGTDPMGTERQYDSQTGIGLGDNPMGNPSFPGLAGTDQQYFGVQFGPSEPPSEEPSKERRKLLFLRAFDESLVQIVRYEWNVRNPRFGQPIMYRVTLNDPREQHSGVGLPMATVFVHWSRIIHVADNRRNSEIFGVPRMRIPLNRLMDLRKLYGASGEGYWRSCFTGISLETHPQLGGDVDIDLTALRDQMENYMNGMQKYLIGMGMSAKTLAPTVIDPTPFIQSYLEAICILIGCPVRVFKGSERGELASSQDDASWNDRLSERQNNYLTPRLIVPFVDRMVQMGVLPEPEEYHIKWPDLDSLNDKDKAAIALTLTQALAAYVSGNCESVLPPHDFFTRFLNFEEEIVDAILESAQKNHENEETMTAPPMISGRPAEAPEGTQDHADAKVQQEQQKAQLDAMKQAKGVAGGPGGKTAGPAGAKAKPTAKAPGLPTKD